MDVRRRLHDGDLLHVCLKKIPVSGCGQVEQFLLQPQVLLHFLTQRFTFLLVLFAAEEPGVLLAVRDDDHPLV